MKHQVNLVFTPSSPAKLSFIERENSVNDDLVDALRTPGMQIILYGHSGAGKTTLLVNKLNQIYEAQIITRCMIGMSIEQLIVDAFDQLNVFYVKDKSQIETMSISADLVSSYLLIQSAFKANITNQSTQSSTRVIPIQLTAQRLAQFFGEAKCCWVLEDFHKIEEKEKVKLSQIMKIFMDLSMDYPDLKLIAIGAVGTAREVVKYDPEMKQRVAEIFVPLMNDQEVAKIIYRGEELLNLKFKSSVVSKIIKFSSGLGAVCHCLCLNMAFSNNINVTSDTLINFGEQDFDAAVEKYVKSNSDTLKAAFDKAIKVDRSRKYENAKEILRAMLELGKDEVTHNEILIRIKKSHPDYPQSNLTTYLKQLQHSERGEIIRYDENSGKYSFSNPFLKAYAFCLISKRTQHSIMDDNSVPLEQLIEAIFSKLSINLENGIK